MKAIDRRTELIKPVVLIVDDIASSVFHLKKSLEASSCCVEIGVTPDEARAFARQRIVDVILLDIRLHAEVDGVGLAEELTLGEGKRKAIAPESSVVFISHPDGEGLNVSNILDMFNLRLTQYDNGGRRLAEAYADKSDVRPAIAFVKYIVRKRGLAFKDVNETGGTLRATLIEAEPATWEDINNQIKRRLSDERFVEPREQVNRILLELCAADLWSPEALVLEKVQKGRSRSLVLSVGRVFKGKTVEQRIIKIGEMATLEMELTNYKARVPSFIGGNAYPALIGFARSRQLSGIAYSEISVGSGLPSTLADQFFVLREEQIISILDRLLHSLLVDPMPPDRSDYELFGSRYIKRFNNLDPAADLHKAVQNVLAKCKYLRVDKDCVKLSGIGDEVRFWNPTKLVREVISQQMGLSFFVSVVHGDFHPDNILLPGRLGEENAFVIDFSHTNQHHAALDYIIMEGMLRSQLLRSLLESRVDGGGHVDWEAVEKWCRIEMLCIEERWSDAMEVGFSLKDHQFTKLILVMKWIRESAHARLPTESRQYYLIGLGLTTYSFLAIRDESLAKSAIREILLIVSSLCFKKVLGPYVPSISVFNLKAAELGDWLSNADGDLDVRLAKTSRTWKGSLLKKGRDIAARLGRWDSALFERMRSMTIAAESRFREQLPQVYQSLSAMTEECWKGAGNRDIAILALVADFCSEVQRLGFNADIIQATSVAITSSERQCWSELRTDAASTE